MQAVEQSPENSLWQVVHAQAVGSSHLTSGLPCQDAAGWRVGVDVAAQVRSVPVGDLGVVGGGGGEGTKIQG
jgi:hypothetical protein